MGSFFYIMGKSASGKDTIYRELLLRPGLGLRPFVIYTTRPIRANEKDGEQYYFVTEEEMRRMEKEGKILELRSYNTVYGIWYYFTADSDSVDLEHFSYLGLGTLESYEKIRDYYGGGRVVPIYLEAADDLRLERYIRRERKQPRPNYSEVCRRFLADQEDFSGDKILRAGIERRFQNNGDREACVEEIAMYIREMDGGEAAGTAAYTGGEAAGTAAYTGGEAAGTAAHTGGEAAESAASQTE